ncbi:hypothetical protein [Leptospira sp. 'Mane']|uniref:hypothetical protein n=1 Tax=Leptospira sp. 'Mane' TaxID=3387407 RepID=UPI00398B3496
MFSPQSSVIVSLLSGAGLVAVVSLAPVRSFDMIDAPSPEPRSHQPLSDSPIFNDSLDSKNPNQYGNSDSTEPKPNEFSLRAPISEELLDKTDKWTGSGLIGESESLSSSIRNRTDWDLYSNRVGERKVFFQKNGLVMRGFASSSSLQNWTPFRRDSYLADRYGFRRNDSYEIQYPITSNIGAVVQGGAYDHFDDRAREQRNVAMAGVSVKTGDFFSARMLTGDSSYVVNTPVSGFNYNPLNPNRPNDISRRERDDIKQLYEWQANFTPSDYFKLQTSVYNQRAENSINLSSPDGGKVSVFAGNQRVQMNVRYNYLNGRNSSSILTGQSFNPSQDQASLGVVVFLDPSQRYSLYLGNNFYNVFNDPLNQVKDGSGKSPTTFTASFRGKNPSANRSSFFLNVQNQFYKDGTILGAPGMMQMGGLQGKSFYEYATSLGLEVAF